jgi:sulfonate transport system substrate-binding protein
MSKKNHLSGLLTLIAIISLATSPASYAADVAWPKEINLGYQKYGPLIVLKSTGELEKRLNEHGVAVKWSEFPAGLPMLEALNAGGLDFAVTGETPPVFAQASKGSPIVYVANEPASPQAEGIIVKADSELKDIAGLKGKKVTVPKGSNAQFFLIQALAKAGLTWDDIEPAYLAPADARAALERGDVAAWSIWDYYYAAAEIQLGTRTLTNGEGLVQNYAFYTSRRDFADKYPELIKEVLDEIRKTDEWIKSKPVEAAEKLAIDIGVDAKILEKALRRSNFGPEYIKPEVIAAQQKIADTLFAIKLLPKQIKVEDAVWQPKK